MRIYTSFCYSMLVVEICDTYFNKNATLIKKVQDCIWRI